MSIEAMKQALDALEGWNYVLDPKPDADIIAALRAAIAEASMQRLTDVQQEMDCYGDGNVYRGQRSSDSRYQTIYEGSFPEKIWEVVPPRREWVSLTEDEIASICVDCAASAHRHDDISYARAIEAKLKEKNHD